MKLELQQAIDEVVELTGAAPPGLLEEDAPVLRQEALDAAAGGSIYLVGLIGGKDVGKSSLVNALVGQRITEPTGHGPGTEIVVAYAHRAAEAELRRMLEGEAPGRYRIVGHQIDQLRRQVLLDLPDIDSKYSDHIQITRRMLRHMLYPLWIQSVEKYADQRPQELLAAVAEGNDPANFLFCLNKADQVVAREGESAARELAEDYAGRVARVIALAERPRVFLISATNPDQADLPELRQRLARQRPGEAVERSGQLAARRQDRSALGWLDRQEIGRRAEQLARLEEDAGEICAERIARPIIDRAIPALLEDPAQRMSLTRPAARKRMSRWPIVSAIDGLLSPVLALVERNLGPGGSGSADPDAYLADGGGERGLAEAVQATFAQLHQTHPEIGSLYRQRKLWEPMHAEGAAAELRQRFALAVQQQRQAVMRQVAGGSGGWLLAPVRWLLTIGALLWFPIVQPVLEIILQQGTWQITRQTLKVLVAVLSVSHLLQSVTFLVLWFGILWVAVRWSTQRRVARLIERWKRAEGTDGQASLPGQTFEWIEELLEPIQRRRQRLQGLAERIEAIRREAEAA